jgi:hypothetical protein
VTSPNQYVALMRLYIALGEPLADAKSGELTSAQADELLALLRPVSVWLDETYGPLPFRRWQTGTVG